MAIAFPDHNLGLIDLAVVSSQLALSTKSHGIVCLFWSHTDSGALGSILSADKSGGAECMDLGYNYSLEAPRISIDNAASSPSGFASPVLAEWGLITTSWNVSSGQVSLWAQSESNAKVTMTPASKTGVDAVDMMLGLADGGCARVNLALLAIFSHTLTSTDHNNVWANRVHPTYCLVTEDGSFIGPSGIADLIGPGPFAAYALIGDAITDANFNAKIAGSTALDEVPAIDAVNQAFTWINAYDQAQPYGDLFVPRPPGAIAGDAFVSGAAPLFKRLANALAPSAPKQIGTTGNSRGISSTDAAGREDPHNFAHGVIASRRSLIGGAWRWAEQTGGVANRRWFAFDYSAAGPAKSGTVISLRIAGVDADAEEFSRFSSGSVVSTEGHPGEGLFLATGASIAPAFQPESGSLFFNGANGGDFPALMRLLLLAYPGCGGLSYRQWRDSAIDRPTPDYYMGAAIDDDSVVGPVSQAHAWVAASDVADSSTQWTISGKNYTGTVAVGHLVFNATSWGPNKVASVALSGSDTVVTFEKAWPNDPSDGDAINFGPGAYHTLDIPFDATATSENIRGADLADSSSSPGSLALLAHGVWRTDVGSFVMQPPIGQGGANYETHTDRQFTNVMRDLVAALQPDAVGMTLATQPGGSGPDQAHADLTGVIRAGKPGVEIVWLGDVEHSSSQAARHQWILDNARAHRVAALTAYEHGSIGNYYDQAGQGFREDPAHLSALGNEAVANAWWDIAIDSDVFKDASAALAVIL